MIELHTKPEDTELIAKLISCFNDLPNREKHILIDLAHAVKKMSKGKIDNVKAAYNLFNDGYNITTEKIEN